MTDETVIPTAGDWVDCLYCLGKIAPMALKCSRCGEFVVDRRMVTEWEYLAAFVDAKSDSAAGSRHALKIELARRGDSGWELVSAIPEYRWDSTVDRSMTYGSYGYSYQSGVVGWSCIFKRPKSRRLVEATEETLAMLENLRVKDAPPGLTYVIQLYIMDAAARAWVLTIENSRVAVRHGATDKPDFVLQGRSAVWQSILAGRRGLVSAYRDDEITFKDEITLSTTNRDDAVLARIAKWLSLKAFDPDVAEQ